MLQYSSHFSIIDRRILCIHRSYSLIILKVTIQQALGFSFLTVAVEHKGKHHWQLLLLLQIVG